MSGLGRFGGAAGVAGAPVALRGCAGCRWAQSAGMRGLCGECGSAPPGAAADAARRVVRGGGVRARTQAETCPASTGGGTRRVQSVREADVISREFLLRELSEEVEC